MASTNDLKEDPISFGIYPPNNYLEIINELCDSSYANLCNDYDPCSDNNFLCVEEILTNINSIISLFQNIIELIITSYNHNNNNNNCCLQET